MILLISLQKLNNLEKATDLNLWFFLGEKAILKLLFFNKKLTFPSKTDII